jgi:hypothetical protein
MLIHQVAVAMRRNRDNHWQAANETAQIDAAANTIQVGHTQVTGDLRYEGT